MAVAQAARPKLTVTTIDITPDVSLLKKAGEVNYKIPQALSELVDNSIDAAVPGEKLHVEVTLTQKGGEKHIIVADDGRGMKDQEAADAMVMARSAKRPGKIGEFGLGLKTAASNLGGWFQIVTTTSDSKVALSLVYDEDEFVKRGEWKIEMERIPKTFARGTLITIKRPKVNIY